MVVEILKQREVGDDIVVDDARLIFTRSKHLPFTARVKGELACPAVSDATHASDELYGDPIQLGRGKDFSSLSGVPKSVLRAVRANAPDCSPQDTVGAGSRYAISSAMTLWEVPCNMYARTASSVYVATLNQSNYASVLLLPPLPDNPSAGQRYEVRLPTMQLRNTSVVSEFYDGDGTCGSYEKCQLRAVEGEAVEFFLTEYRNKERCDGRQGEARTFPMVFSAH